MERLETGIARLDYVLQGGLPKQSLHLLQGPPGSGKTVAANQLCFEHARREKGRSVYVTVAAESHSKIVESVRSFDFFDAQMVGECVYFVSGYSTLRDQGMKAFLNLIQSTVQAHEADLVVIDGIQTVCSHVESLQDYRAWLHVLQSMLTMLEATGVVLATLNQGEQSGEESVVCDSVTEFTYNLVGPRFVREVIIYKLRGSGYLAGRHQMEITEQGVVVHPRTEVQFSDPSQVADENRIRMRFGVDGLDQMMRGGVFSGSATTLIGAAGAGKSTLGLAFLVEGAKKGQKGYYYGFAEPPPRLIERARNVGLELQEYVDQGLIELMWQPPLEHFLDAVAESLLDKMRADKDSEKRRLFIDGVEGLVVAAVYKDRLNRFLAAFFNQLRTLDVTTVITEEIHAGNLDRIEARTLSEVETAIVLQSVRHGASFHRLISVIKMRESAYDRFVHEFDITDEGFCVASDKSSAEKFLGGGS